MQLPQRDSSLARTIRLTAITDGIVRVEATPDITVPKKKKSLVVLQEVLADSKAWNVDETSSNYILTTAKLKVEVDKQTGRIVFIDLKTGKKLLSEMAEGGKTFKRYISNQTHLPETFIPSSPEELNWGKADSLNVIELGNKAFGFDTVADNAVAHLNTKEDILHAAVVDCITGFYIAAVVCPDHKT